MKATLITYYGETSEGKLQELSFYIKIETFEEKIKELTKDGLFGKNAVIALEKVGVKAKDIMIILWNYSQFIKLDNFTGETFDFLVDREELDTEHNKNVTWGDKILI